MTIDTDAPAAIPVRMTPRQRRVLVLLLGAQFVLAVDFSILNVALPAIGDGLGFTVDSLQWIATAFALPAAGFTLLFGRVADLAGRRRMFLAGMVLLGVASLAGGLAGSPEILLAARVAQGLATAIATPAALSLITTSFAEGPLRSKALGMAAALMAGGFTAGALLGGVLTDLLSWRWAFLVNVPIAAAIAVATPLLLAESRVPERVRLDVPGAVTVTGGLLAVVYGVTTEPLALGVGAVLLVAFWFVERRSPAPLVPVRVLGRRSVGWGNFAGFFAFAGSTPVVFLMTLYLQEVLGYSALQAGLVFVVPGAAGAIGGIAAPRLIARVGATRSLALGFTAQGLAFAALLLTGGSGTGLAIVLASTAVGFFLNLYVIVAFTVTVTSGLPDHEQGLATGLSTMSQQVGITLGIPVLSAVVAARPVLLDGIHAAVLADVAATAVVAVLLAVFLRHRDLYGQLTN